MIHKWGSGRRASEYRGEPRPGRRFGLRFGREPWCRGEAERGDAIVEFVVLTVVLIVPVIYFVVSLAAVQATMFAAEAGAREAARVLAADPGDVDVARAQVDLAFMDFGLSTPASVEMGCVPVGCGGERPRMQVTISTTVPLPLVPSWVGQPGLIPVSATSQALVEGLSVDGW